jgi:hypothetical protein
VPFCVLSPFIWIGRIGLSVFEVILLLTFFYYLTICTRIKINIFVLFFTLSCALFFLLAILNSYYIYNISLSLGDLKIFYYTLLTISGFYIGYSSKSTILDIGQSAYFKFITYVVFGFVILYIFNDYHGRLELLRFYYHPEIDEKRRFLMFHDFRFPGLGINAVLYSYLILILFMISATCYLEKKISFHFVAINFFIILSCASKTSIILCLFFLLYIFTFHKGFPSQRYKLITYLFTSVALPLLLFVVTFGFERSLELFSFIERMSHIFDSGTDSSTFHTRFNKWNMGLDRISNSPIFGIKIDSTNVSPILRFPDPHNEFLWMWSYRGIGTVLLHVILILALVLFNLYNKTKCTSFWVMLYTTLTLQMFFDSAFSCVRFYGFFFMLVGLNLREIKNSNIENVFLFKKTTL